MSTSSTACSDSVCSICLDTCSVVSYADGCLHKFCGRCIFEWAQRSQLCPICRTFFANIITNVTSDTDYEVIPLEDRRVPVSNFIRNSCNPPSRAISQQHQHQHQQQQQGNEGYQAISRLEEPDIGNLQIDNPRPRRIVWSSNRYSNRQFNRQQPQPTSSHHENVVALRQIISPAFRTDYHNRGHNQPLTSPRHSFNPRPFRPLVATSSFTFTFLSSTTFTPSPSLSLALSPSPSSLSL
ncbi:uncharacterized protein LOC128393600 [Panonychus citri]|uniref:uncharacterized protein LOC128393600 n=1 Tax=Panonychus citri TaxID=50023 RepID=UPI002307F843|nr:uncharacterized protein LOC128393600 [Panonychus citri]